MQIYHNLQNKSLESNEKTTKYNYLLTFYSYIVC